MKISGMTEGIKWTVGNGNSVSLIEDWWCENSSFEIREIDLNSILSNRKVNMIMDSNGKWDHDIIHNDIP